MRIFFTIVLSLYFNLSSAQYFYYDDQYYDKDLLFEGGLSFGIMNSSTDVGKRNGSLISPGFYDWGSSKIAFGIYGGAMYKNLFGARVEITSGTVAGADSRSNLSYVKTRNLSYKSSLLEVNLTGQFYPLSLLNMEDIPSFSPYIFTGIGMFAYHPKALYNDKWYELRKLHTEGQNDPAFPQRKEYSITAWSLPVGLGIKYEYSAKINVRFEGNFRFTTTDYLDDVSTTYIDPAILATTERIMLAHRYREINPNRDLTGRNRGNPNINDRFFTITLKVGYVLGRSKIPVNDVP